MMTKVFGFLTSFLGRFILCSAIAVLSLAAGVKQHSTLLMLGGAVWCWSSGLWFAAYFDNKVIATYKKVIDMVSIK